MSITFNNFNNFPKLATTDMPECIIRWALHIIEDASNNCLLTTDVVLVGHTFDNMDFLVISQDIDVEHFIKTVKATPGYLLNPDLYRVRSIQQKPDQFTLHFYACASWRALANRSEIQEFACRPLDVELEPPNHITETPFKLAEALASDLTLAEHGTLMLLIPHAVEQGLIRIASARRWMTYAESHHWNTSKTSYPFKRLQADATWLSENLESLQSLFTKVVPTAEQPAIFAKAQAKLHSLIAEEPDLVLNTKEESNAE